MLKSALQIVAAERGIKNAAAVAAAHAQQVRNASRGDPADSPPAKRFAASGAAGSGSRPMALPVAAARLGSSQLSPRESGMSAAQNNAICAAPSGSLCSAPSGSLHPIASVGTPSQRAGFEPQRSNLSLSGPRTGGADAPGLQEAITDVTTLEVNPDPNPNP